ncbi:chemotaxis protein CheA [Gluconacetobacter johannae DSM 13595]|uniref:Chemotaxis protein CheA n=1 Tax=Gluconacetobacter johannae TaxID=112140 RepID=A0A7W4P3F1_9PROT|nr:chemotaxis protein CheA [Gluconacetobacter johannae]MBB2176096.1 chemotaxis protein CheA [Gluconacetobacter johannae]GBQ80047.1 chemotaxis protein CheA [Gluconacetobacter johannae DSM 13595]
MSGDMGDILLVFFQECDEQLQELERGLSALSDGESEQETINAVFRAVHSIKGGAASFGLENLVRFAHVFESSLDGVRSGRVAPTQDIVKIFLKAMDVLSDLVVEARDGGPTVDPGRVAESQAELEFIIGSNGEAPKTDDIVPSDFVPVPMDFVPVPVDFEPVPVDFGLDFGFDAAPGQPPAPLIVTFCPHDAMYARGDDARNILIGLTDAAVAVEGEITVTCDVSTLPSFAELEPDRSYLSWRVVLPAEVSEDTVQSVFDWGGDVCDFTISREGEPAPDGGEAVPAMEAQPPGEGSQAAAPPEPALPAVPETSSSSGVAAAQVVPAASPAVAPAPAAGGANAAPVRRTEQATIRVDLPRIDNLMDLVGELVIAQAALESQCRRANASMPRELGESIASMQSLTRDIQDAVMAVRAQPVRSVFQRMQRVVREACSMTKKDVVLTLEGEDTEVDRTLVEKLSDPLTHMLRNAIDHGIEKVEDRLAAGKSAVGQILLSASHRSGHILITIKDDGGGINRERVLATAIKRGIVAPDAVLTDDEINNLIFAPGFSTADTVSNLSGRGVGMDVVKQAILSLGGRVTIQSVPGSGTVFCLSLPLTLAVLDGMLIVAGGATMVIPVSSVVETMIIKPQDTYVLPDGKKMVSIRGDCIPMVPLGSQLGLSAYVSDEPQNGAVMLIVENESGARVGLVVDEIRDQAHVVIKSMEKNYRRIPGVSAATILGDGSVSLILDAPALIASAVGRINTKVSDARAVLAA